MGLYLNHSAIMPASSKVRRFTFTSKLTVNGKQQTRGLEGGCCLEVIFLDFFFL